MNHPPFITIDRWYNKPFRVVYDIVIPTLITQFTIVIPHLLLLYPWWSGDGLSLPTLIQMLEAFTSAASYPPGTSSASSSQRLLRPSTSRARPKTQSAAAKPCRPRAPREPQILLTRRTLPVIFWGERNIWKKYKKVRCKIQYKRMIDVSFRYTGFRGGSYNGIPKVTTLTSILRHGLTTWVILVPLWL